MAFATRLLHTLATCALLTTAATAQKTPDDALHALQEGNRRFAAGQTVPQPVGEGVRRTLARGQSPFAIVLCCADSRVPPEHVFNTGLGELFVVRVAGNTCDEETLASIEYAVEHLDTSLCVVLGHENCGAVGAAVDQVAAQGQNHDGAPSHALEQLLEHIEPAVRKAMARQLGGTELRNAAEEEHVQMTVTECLRRSALLRRYASVGKFRMVGARYHLQSGEVEWLPVRPVPSEEPAGEHVVAGATPVGVPPHVALRMLQAGHRRFLRDGLPAGDLSATRREQLSFGQQPLAIVLTCADSRVAPEHVFDAGLGELFVIRIAGNTLNDDALASIEYAASHTGASLLVVMGHTRCGAITAATQDPEHTELTPSMRSLLTRLEPAVAAERAKGYRGDELVEMAVRANVLRTLAESRSRSRILRELETAGRFAMLPCVYDIASGDITWLKDAAEGRDQPVVGEPRPAAPAGETAHGNPTPAHGAATDSHGEPAGHDGHAAGDAHDSAGPNEHGEPAHDQPAARDSHDAHAAREAPAAAGHRETAALPTLDWADPHSLTSSEHTAPAAEHGEAAHGEGVAPDQHAADGDAAAHAPASGHGEHAEPAKGQANAANPLAALWTDPIMLVGMCGVASLLLAALLALTGRK